jgi:hypothetical protein
MFQGTGNVTQWLSACLGGRRPRTQSSISHKKEQIQDLELIQMSETFIALP